MRVAPTVPRAPAAGSWAEKIGFKRPLPAPPGMYVPAWPEPPLPPAREPAAPTPRPSKLTFWASVMLDRRLPRPPPLLTSFMYASSSSSVISARSGASAIPFAALAAAAAAAEVAKSAGNRFFGPVTTIGFFSASMSSAVFSAGVCCAVFNVPASIAPTGTGNDAAKGNPDPDASLFASTSIGSTPA